MTHFQWSIGNAKQTDYKKQEYPKADVLEKFQCNSLNYRQIYLLMAGEQRVILVALSEMYGTFLIINNTLRLAGGIVFKYPLSKLFIK